MATLVDEKLKTYKTLQEDLQNLYIQKQKFLSQLNENVLVKGEMDLLGEDSKIFKLVGPVLLKVDSDEAKDNVKKRIEFIEKELKKIEDIVDKKQKDQNDVGNEIAEMQQKMQADAMAAVTSTVAPNNTTATVKA